MPAERFYLDADFNKGTSVEMEGPELHHLAHVMRVQPGEQVELVNGRGSLASATVLTINKRTASLEILSSKETQVGPAQRILAVPLMRPSKLEWVVEKGTELGADAFRLYAADHSEKDTLSSNQLERLRSIAISAMKQSGRLDLPSLAIGEPFAELFSFSGHSLFGDLDPNAPFLSTVKIDLPVQFITGPEKGFSKNELTQLREKAKGVRLHKNILRAETAPIAALALLYTFD